MMAKDWLQFEYVINLQYIAASNEIVGEIWSIVFQILQAIQCGFPVIINNGETN